MKVIDIKKIKTNPNNPRIIKDDNFNKLVKSLTDFPEMMAKRPMVCVTDNDGKIYPLGGNMRLKALQEIGYKEIPIEWILLADEWNAEQRNEFVIKDNIGFGEWDWDMIADSWDYDKLNEWGLMIPGFNMDSDFNEDTEYKFMNKVTIEFNTTEEAQSYFDSITKQGLKAKLS